MSFKDKVSKSAIIIEDSVVFADAMKVWLENKDYEVEVAFNRDEGLAILKERSFDLLLMDYHMNGMSAEQFIPLARELHPKMMTLLLTANPNAYEIASRLRISYVCQKPFDDAFLNSMIARLFARRKHEQEMEEFRRSL